MFQGSAHVGSGQHIALLQAAGASVNATTWFDRTNYFEALPTGGLDLALWLEADRLGTLLDALTQESLDNQREVVKEEKRQRYDNVPYGDVMELLNALTFPPDHPYGHTTIGSMDDLNAATLADVQRLLPHPLRCPNNAVLSIVGDVDPEDAFANAADLLRPPGRRSQARSESPREPLPPLTGTERQETSADVPADAIYLAWRLPARGHQGLRRPRPGLRACSVTARRRGCTSNWSAAPSTPRAPRPRAPGADRRQLVRLRVRPGPRRHLRRTSSRQSWWPRSTGWSTTGRPSRSCGGPRRSTSGTGCTSSPGSIRAPTHWASTPPCTATRP